MDLTELRAAIDEVDGELLTLLHRRAEISRMVGAAKKDEGGPVFRPEREQEVVERLLRINRESRGEGLPDEHIARIWREIFSSSRALQRPLRAAFLGPEGTFSHMAALECLGHSISAAPCENFDAVFRAVAEGTCDLGLVPLENSLHGSIGQCIDLFAEYDVHVVGEHYSRIRLCLMSRESGLSAVRRVYSHPQPFGQSRGWLRAICRAPRSCRRSPPPPPRSGSGTRPVPPPSGIPVWPPCSGLMCWLIPWRIPLPTGHVSPSSRRGGRPVRPVRNPARR